MTRTGKPRRSLRLLQSAPGTAALVAASGEAGAAAAAAPPSLATLALLRARALVASLVQRARSGGVCAGGGGPCSLSCRPDDEAAAPLLQRGFRGPFNGVSTGFQQAPPLQPTSSTWPASRLPSLRARKVGPSDVAAPPADGDGDGCGFSRTPPPPTAAAVAKERWEEHYQRADLWYAAHMLERDCVLVVWAVSLAFSAAYGSIVAVQLLLGMFIDPNGVTPCATAVVALSPRLVPARRPGGLQGRRMPGARRRRDPRAPRAPPRGGALAVAGPRRRRRRRRRAGGRRAAAAALAEAGAGAGMWRGREGAAAAAAGLSIDSEVRRNPASRAARRAVMATMQAGRRAHEAAAQWPRPPCSPAENMPWCPGRSAPALKAWKEGRGTLAREGPESQARTAGSMEAERVEVQIAAGQGMVAREDSEEAMAGEKESRLPPPARRGEGGGRR